MFKLINAVSVIMVLTFITCEKDEKSPEFPKDLKLGSSVSSGCLNNQLNLKSTNTGYFEYSVGSNYIEIKHTGIHTHCGADLSFEMQITAENKIILKEIDNSIGVANCLCYFNISTKIENVVMGLNYEIEIWNEDMTELLDKRTINT